MTVEQTIELHDALQAAARRVLDERGWRVVAETGALFGETLVIEHENGERRWLTLQGDVEPLVEPDVGTSVRFYRQGDRVGVVLSRWPGGVYVRWRGASGVSHDETVSNGAYLVESQTDG